MQKKTICQHYLMGKCKFGDKCRNIHPDDINMRSQNSQQNPVKAPNKSSTCHFFLNNKCDKKEKCEYFHGYCDRLQYVKTIGNHKNEINNLVNMYETKFISSDFETFYMIDSGTNQFQGENITQEYKIGKLIYSNNKIIFGIQKGGM
jgi:hypothetical protein